MAVMLGKLYTALRTANVPDDQAAAAAEEAAEQQITLTRIATELTFHRWAFGLIIALQFAVLIKLFVK